MAPSRPTVDLLAEEEFAGYGACSSGYDSFLTRDGANWLVARTGDTIAVARVAAGTGRVLDEVRRWPHPRPDGGRAYASPLPDGGLAVVGDGLVTVYEADARVRWTHEFTPWTAGTGASPACVADPAGRRLLVTTPGDLPARPYPGDLCVALDLADGRPVGRAQLPSASAGYAFKQSLTHPAQLLLDAAQGDTFFTLAIGAADGGLSADRTGLPTELAAGVGLGGAFLHLDVGGEWLSRYEAGQPEVRVDAEDVLPEDFRFVGYRTGFLDEGRVLAAAAEEEDSDENSHLLLDGRTLAPVAELDYPGTVAYDPLALGDGTWLTVEDDTLRRWRLA
ncbi:hypothetical protein ACIBL6_01660 [Streptomyces sp. NPDC050400]|uniref:hypothetical protein n=1 Tax=Streptomyces sp. NPDC050400 TaxID=3365610 RepID=UPI0037977CDD